MCWNETKRRVAWRCVEAEVTARWAVDLPVKKDRIPHTSGKPFAPPHSFALGLQTSYFPGISATNRTTAVSVEITDRPLRRRRVRSGSVRSNERISHAA